MAKCDDTSSRSVNSLHTVGEPYPSVLPRCNTRRTFRCELASISGYCLLAVCLHDVEVNERQYLDTTALSYVNLERPNIAVEENRMKLRSGRLLGEYINGGKTISYRIPGVSQPWDFTGHVARQSFQDVLGHILDRSTGPTELDDGKAKQIK